MFVLTYGLRNLRRNLLRSAVTLLGVASLLFLVSFLASIVAGLQASTERDAGGLRLVTRHEISLTFNLPLAYRDKILARPHVQAVSPSNWFGGLWVDESRQFARFFVEPALFLPIMTGIHLPPEQAAAWVADRRGCILAERLATRYGVQLGDTLTLQGDIYPVNPELIVLGIYTGEEEALYFHRAYVEEALDQSVGVGTFMTLVDAPEHLPAVAAGIDALFENSDAATRTETEQAFRAGFVSMLGNVQGLVTNLTLVLAITILLTAGNTMAMSVRERRTEIAVLKALGFLPRRIATLVAAESGLLGLGAGLLGAGGYALFSWLVFVVADVRIPMMWFQLTLPPLVLVLLLVASLLLGIVAGLVPAVVAARRSVVAGLRRN